MEELIAKRYIDALNSMVETSSFESYAKVFETLALEFKNEKVINRNDANSNYNFNGGGCFNCRRES
jgi:hypothetical protein